MLAFLENLIWIGKLAGWWGLMSNPKWEGCCCYLVTESRLTLWDLMDCSPPASSVHGIFQARILEWVAISFSRGSSPPRNWTCFSCIGRKVFYHWATKGSPSEREGEMNRKFTQIKLRRRRKGGWKEEEEEEKKKGLKPLRFCNYAVYPPMHKQPRFKSHNGQ